MECNPRDYDYSKLVGKTVLELGSGCGLAGIAFMMKGAVVTCTDLSAVTTALTTKNVNVSYYSMLILPLHPGDDNLATSYIY